MRPVFAIVLRQLYLMKGSVARLVPIFAWAMLDIVLWGFITRYLSSVTGEVNFVSIMLGGALLWNFLNRAMQGLTLAFFEDVWSRNFINIFTAPITIAHYLGGLVLTSLTTTLLALLVMCAMAWAAFGFTLAVYGAMALPFVLVLFLFGIALGFLGCALVMRFGPAAEWFVWATIAVLSPFAGVFYPIDVLPGWMQALAYALPPAHVFTGLRAVVEHGTLPWQPLGIAAGLALFYIGLAYAVFIGAYRRAVRTGLIARYSAETVG